MSSHLLAWFEDVTQDVLTDIQPVTDGIWTIQNNHFLPQDQWDLLWISVFSLSTPVRARLVTPTYRQFSPPYISPMNATFTPAAQQAIFAQSYLGNPLRIPALEELQLDAEQSAIAAEEMYGVAAVTRRMVPAPTGDSYSIRGVSTTAAGAQAWTQVVVTWDDTLPNGIYAVTGLVYQAVADNIAARLIFEDQVDRPGVVGSGVSTIVSPIVNRFGAMGEFGRFTAFRFPNVEVLAESAITDHTFFMDLVRVG